MHFTDLVSISLSRLIHFIYLVSISLATSLLPREVWLARSNGTSPLLDLPGPPCTAYQEEGADAYADADAC